MNRYLLYQWIFLTTIVSAAIILFWICWLGVFGSLPAPPELPYLSDWIRDYPLVTFLSSRWADPLLFIWVWRIVWNGLHHCQNPKERAEVVSAMLCSIAGGILLMTLPPFIGFLVSVIAIAVVSGASSDEKVTTMLRKKKTKLDDDELRFNKRTYGCVRGGFALAMGIGYGFLPGFILLLAAITVLVAAAIAIILLSLSDVFLSKTLSGKLLWLTNWLTGGWNIQ